MGARTLAGIAVAVSIAACGQSGTYLRPGPGAQPAGVGPGEGVLASDAGVVVEVRTRAWSGDPVSLEDEITPLHLEITNNSQHPLLVRYDNFTLVQGSERYAAIAPYEIHEDVTEDVSFAGYPYNGYRVAPYLRNYYPGLRVADPFWWDYGYPYYYDVWPTYVTIDLPTRDMIQAALPEGVLMPGQKISGFIYFEELDDDVPDVGFALDLVDAATRARFGRVLIPFTAY